MLGVGRVVAPVVCGWSLFRRVCRPPAKLQGVNVAPITSNIMIQSYCNVSSLH